MFYPSICVCGFVCVYVLYDYEMFLTGSYMQYLFSRCWLHFRKLQNLWESGIVLSLWGRRAQEHDFDSCHWTLLPDSCELYFLLLALLLPQQSRWIPATMVWLHEPKYNIHHQVVLSGFWPQWCTSYEHTNMVYWIDFPSWRLQLSLF